MKRFQCKLKRIIMSSLCILKSIKTCTLYLITSSFVVSLLCFLLLKLKNKWDVRYSAASLAKLLYLAKTSDKLSLSGSDLLFVDSVSETNFITRKIGSINRTQLRASCNKDHANQHYRSLPNSINCRIWLVVYVQVENLAKSNLTQLVLLYERLVRICNLRKLWINFQAGSKLL
jgi:hypothetical protein